MIQSEDDGFTPTESATPTTGVAAPEAVGAAAGLVRPRASARGESRKPQKFSKDCGGIDWAKSLPFIGMHVACLFVFAVGVSWIAVGVAVALYVVRMFAITGFYHRYFSHRTFKTSRFAQFLFAALGNSSVQRGPLWWAAHHRHHHRNSDQEDDIHSPLQRGFLFSHTLWFLTREADKTDYSSVRDFAKYRELRFIDRFDTLIPIGLGVATFFLGWALEAWAPGLGTNGWQMLVWGFFVSTVALYHGTYTINSLSHTFGSRRFKTTDTSRNNFLLAMITLGEGWHNNHHHYQTATRQGFYWWEIDITYYILKAMSWTGLVWDLRPVPAHVLAEGRKSD